MTAAERKVEAQVIARPVALLFQHKTDNGTLFTKSPEGQKIAVVGDSEIIWEKDVYPFFVGIRRVFGINVPRPRYEQRVAATEKRARQLASARNFINASKG